MDLKTVKVPKPFEPLFESAEKYVSKYFSGMNMEPETGKIEIGGERYVLVRAASLSVHFLKFIAQVYPSLNQDEAFSAASKILFDMAKMIGKNDSIAFHKATSVVDPIAKLSTGPIHFAHSGWAFVEISAKSSPTPDENYYLLYDHPQSFEADSWLASKERPPQCVCHMNAGYSTGWCEESFGIELIAREVFCRAKGDPHCRFIMAAPHRIEEFVFQFLKDHNF